MILNKSNIHQYIYGDMLSCSNLGITSIEDIPDNITHIYCSNNNLTELPELPDGLIGLDCDDNQLTILPKLPDGLRRLDCYHNELTSFPTSFDDKQWMVNHNKLLHRSTIINKIYDIK